jgi:hypothetical protein
MNPKFHDLVVTHWGARFMGCNLAVASRSIWNF